MVSLSAVRCPTCLRELVAQLLSDTGCQKQNKKGGVRRHDGKNRHQPARAAQRLSTHHGQRDEKSLGAGAGRQVCVSVCVDFAILLYLVLSLCSFHPVVYRLRLTPDLAAVGSVRQALLVDNGCVCAFLFSRSLKHKDTWAHAWHASRGQKKEKDSIAYMEVGSWQSVPMYLRTHSLPCRRQAVRKKKKVPAVIRTHVFSIRTFCNSAGGLQ